MESTPPVAFASAAAARLGLQQFAMRPPPSSRMAAAGGRVKEFAERLKPQAWQAENYGFANDIGELGYVLTTYASAVSNGDIEIVEENEWGRPIEPEKGDDGYPIFEGNREKAERVRMALRGPEGGPKSILNAHAVHDPVAGEALLYGEVVEEAGKDGPEALAWEVVSVLEITEDPQTGVKQRKRSATKSGALSVADKSQNSEDTVPGDSVLFRYLRRDWAFSGDATSALRRNAAVCREIVFLDQLKETMVLSRLSAGVLFVPEEVEFPSDEDEDIHDVDHAKRFSAMLTSNMSAPIEDRASQASLVPLVVTVPADMIEKFRLMSLSDGIIDLAAVEEARQASLGRLAAGLDIPQERMTGLGATNHWNAASLTVDEIQNHVKPLGERIARFLTLSYLRKMLVEFEDMTEAEAERFRFEYVAPESRVDVAVSAESLHDKDLLSDDALVAARGFDPDEVRPSPEELARRYAKKAALLPAVSHRGLLPAVIDFDLLPEVDTDDIWGPEQAPPQFPPAGPQPPEPVGEEPEVEEPSATVQTPGGSAQPGDPTELAMLERIRATASAAVDAALQKAATQVVNRASKLPADTRAKVEAVPRSRARKPEVLHALNATDWSRIQLRPDKLIADQLDDFAGHTTAWLATHWEDRGIPPEAAHRRACTAATAIRDTVQALAVQGTEAPLRRFDGLVVPLDAIEICVSGSAS